MSARRRGADELAGAIQFGSSLHHLKMLEPAHAGAARVLVYGCADAGQVGACEIEGIE